MRTKKRRDEVFARNAYGSFLLQRGISALDWTDVPAVQEPPDFYLTIDGSRFAVEVTTMVEKLRVGGAPRSELQLTASLTRFVTDTENQARSAGFLKGTYAVLLEPIDDFRAASAQARSLLLEYLRTTASLSTADEHEILRQDNRRWRVRKVGPHGSLLGEVISGDAKFEGDAIDEVRGLLEETLAVKSRKLDSEPAPRILLLLDRYHCLGDDGWARASSELPQRHDFQSLIRIRPPGTCQVLAGAGTIV